MAKKLSQKQLSLLRAKYLAQREEILKGRVNALSVKLFDRVFEQYLIALESDNGNLINSERNMNMVKGLEAIYNVFRTNDNIPVIRNFIGDLQGIVPLNEKYFKNIAQAGVRAEAENVKAVVNRQIGITENGELRAGGFAEKFINDNSVLRKIKKETTKALTKGMGFQDFKNSLKETIQGSPLKDGALQQYYRTYAYDTFQKVDRLAQDKFAVEIGLRYFFWQGGLIKTSRPICEKCNGKIIDSTTFKELKFSDLKEEYQHGMDDSWQPMNDLGGFNCRHSKDYISDAVARQLSSRILRTSELT